MGVMWWQQVVHLVQVCALQLNELNLDVSRQQPGREQQAIWAILTHPDHLQGTVSCAESLA